MTIFIGADHRGFELKDQVTEYLQSKNIRTEDLGNYEYDPQDDNPIYAQKIAQAVLQNPDEHLGIVICGSGVGVSIAANRYKGIYCGVGLNPDQVKNIREHDHINMLALAADYQSFEQVKKMIDIFIQTSKNLQKKYVKRLKIMDQENLEGHYHVRI